MCNNKSSLSYAGIYSSSNYSNKYLHWTVKMMCLFVYTLFAYFSFIPVSFQTSVEEACIVKEFEEVNNVINNCEDIILDNLDIPGGDQLILNLSEGSTLTFRGNTSFNFYEWTGPLMTISGNNIKVIGEKDSVIDGRGPLWWDGQGTWGSKKPRLLKIQVTNAVFDGINIKDCPSLCAMVNGDNLVIKNWFINILEGDEGVAPENKFAHNTDGLHLEHYYSNENVTIENCVIYNQDDCIAIARAKNVTVRNLFCHGSHGLTISGTNSTIEDVLFENSIITMAQNGIHVKTHVLDGDGLIKNVVYRNITILDAKNYGISVEQNYLNLPAGQPQDGPPSNHIPIYNLSMQNIYGNVLSGGIPVFILCADEGCFDWKWENVNILGDNQNNNCTGYAPEQYEC
ncbi:polygalacturonase [Dendroctonus ponderosae]|uniref:polygalacturonase n=1 Tax=Dendroctonus ponderosae TaxID=77166 RepID=UPI002034D79C|nr:polygalacturonase [Dendroctonus ponderosae]